MPSSHPEGGNTHERGCGQCSAACLHVLQHVVPPDHVASSHLMLCYVCVCVCRDTHMETSRDIRTHMMHACLDAYMHTFMQVCIHAARQSDRPTASQPASQPARQTDRDIHTDRQTYDTCKHAYGQAGRQANRPLPHNICT